MALQPERMRLLAQREVSMENTFQDIMSRIPDTVTIARIETKHSRLAQTPEGRFTLTYLLAARDLLKPALLDLTNIAPDFLVSVGGRPHNPERNIDTVGTEIVREIARNTKNLPGAWMHSEASPDWEPLNRTETERSTGKTFIVVDPLDMTSAIPRQDRVQTTGIAIYDKEGQLKSLGIQSLVDEEFMFIENVDGVLHVYPHEGIPNGDTPPDGTPLRIAAKVRRMPELRNLPIFATGNNLWSLNCDSGYAILGIHDGTIDTVIDPHKGSLWYEVVIWARLAQAMGCTVTDADGNPIDISAVMRHVINKHEDDSYRIPFVISRTPQIHERVLPLLHKN